MPYPINNVQKKQLQKLGAKVRAIRESKGFTLEEVGGKTGKDRQSIHKLEKGIFNPSYLYLTDICKGLGITMDELFEE